METLDFVNRVTLLMPKACRGAYHVNVFIATAKCQLSNGGNAAKRSDVEKELKSIALEKSKLPKIWKEFELHKLGELNSEFRRNGSITEFSLDMNNREVSVLVKEIGRLDK